MARSAGPGTASPATAWGLLSPRSVVGVGPIVLARVLPSFSGPRRNFDVERCIQTAADRMGARAIVESIDVSISEEHDLLQDHVYDALRKACLAGLFDAHISGPPWWTWRAACHRPGGPPPLRLRSDLYGRRNLTQRQPEKVDGDTSLMRRSMVLSAAVVDSRGGVFAVETPAGRGRAPLASRFLAEEAAMLRSNAPAEK